MCIRDRYMGRAGEEEAALQEEEDTEEAEEEEPLEAIITRAAIDKAMALPRVKYFQSHIEVHTKEDINKKEKCNIARNNNFIIEEKQEAGDLAHTERKSKTHSMEKNSLPDSLLEDAGREGVLPQGLQELNLEIAPTEDQDTDLWAEIYVAHTTDLTIH
eukprot:TRINITY_DN9955_c0_g1_i16.p3 TRINITY_DN9955_c0_g1~~TRINITY_DN9955_c0_g1_i16.p3  ORF type:complete len:159 (+),score=31.32 TRINITY_DN9955_c0_g1_i16:171-647(+)